MLKVLFTVFFLLPCKDILAQVSDSLLINGDAYKLEMKLELNDSIKSIICHNIDDCINSNFVYSSKFTVNNDSIFLSYLKVYSPKDTIIYLSETEFSGEARYYKGLMFFYPNQYLASPKDIYSIRVFKNKVIEIKQYTNYIDNENYFDRHNPDEIETTIARLLFTGKIIFSTENDTINFRICKNGLLVFETNSLTKNNEKKLKAINKSNKYFDIIQKENYPLDIYYTATLNGNMVKLKKSNIK